MSKNSKLEALTASMARMAVASKAEATREAYGTDMRRYAKWAADFEIEQLFTSQTLAMHAVWMAEKGHAVATILRAVSAINQESLSRGHGDLRGDAGCQEVLQGVQRTYGAPQTRKKPVSVADVRRMVEAAGDTGLRAVRDRALILLGFAGGFRRSELCRLDVSDLDRCEDGLRVTIRKSKGDQRGVGRTIGIAYGQDEETCPVAAVEAWLSESGFTDGPLFTGVTRYGRTTGKRLTPKVVALTVKRLAEAVGLDPAQYAGHSLRAGLATAAAVAGAEERTIMAQTGHRTREMVGRYIRDARLFSENAAAIAGL